MAGQVVAQRGTVRVRVVSDKWDELRGDLHRQAAAIVAKAAHDIEAATKRNIQNAGLIDTGAMVNGVTAQPTGDPLRWLVVSQQHYHLFHEYGTRFLPAIPTMTPAAEEVAGSFASAMRGLLGRAGAAA